MQGVRLGFVAILFGSVVASTSCSSPHRNFGEGKAGKGGSDGGEGPSTAGSSSAGSGYAGGGSGSGGSAGTGTGGDANGGDPNVGDGGAPPLATCTAPERECVGECIGADQCCGGAECGAGKSCVSHECACDEGTKACGDLCIANSACCVDADCPTGGKCSDGVCSCPNDTHQCDAACVANNSPDHCGTACEACTKPTGGSATCDGTVCGGSCPTDQKLCAGTCIAKASACNGTCPSGSHDCTGLCVANTSVTACGSSCNPCPVPANSDATCSNDTCGFTCKTDYKKCGSACIAKTACCTKADCQTGASCNNGACTCDSGKSCSGTCIAASGCCAAGDCTSPPATTCANSTTQRSFSGGACSAGHTCSYTQNDKTCTYGCKNNACVNLYPTQIVVGAGHACALISDGTVYCWGNQGRLGTGKDEQSSTALKVTGVSTATQLTAGGSTTCALLADGTAKCWGDDSDAQIDGVPVSGYYLTPTAVPGLANSTQIETDGFATAARISNSTVRVWGRNGDASSTSTAHFLTGLTTAKALGSSNNCAILNNGTVQCWDGADGTPTTVSGVTSVTQVSKDCALSSDGSVRCWTALDPPAKIDNLGAATRISSSSTHTCAIQSSDKKLYCWGKDGFFGTIDYGPVPVAVGGVGTVVDVSTAESQTCALQTDHVVKCWGWNMFGQLGDGSTMSTTTPVIVKGLPNGT